MKKLILASVLTAVACGAYAQGQFLFDNTKTSPLAPIYVDTVGGTKVDNTAMGNARVGVIMGLSSGYVDAVAGTLVHAAGNGVLAWNNINTSLKAVPFNNAGAKAGYANTTGANVYQTDLGGASVAKMQLVAWYSPTTLYTTWTAAYNAAYGIGGPADLLIKIGASQVVTITLSTGPTDPNVANIKPNWTSFAIREVPEPTSAALAGLGLAGLMMFRRRK